MPASLPGLRRVMRGVLAHHLGARGLKSWEMLAGLSPGARDPLRSLDATAVAAADYVPPTDPPKDE